MIDVQRYRDDSMAWLESEATVSRQAARAMRNMMDPLEARERMGRQDGDSL
jgi:hypothetical protein